MKYREPLHMGLSAALASRVPGLVPFLDPALHFG